MTPMDVQEIRHRNLVALVEEFGGQKALADHVQPTAVGHISQMFNKSRSMGTMVARRFEKCLRKPHGWMDMLHEDDGSPRKEPAREVQQPLPDTIRNQVGSIMDRTLFDWIFDAVSLAKIANGLDSYSRSLLVTQLYLKLASEGGRLTNDRIMVTMKQLGILQSDHETNQYGG